MINDINRENQLAMIKELTELGYTYKDINDIYKYILPPQAVEIILKWLPEIYKDHLGSGEHLVRSLISTEQPFNPEVLINLFENSNYNKSIKCTIAYVLAIAKTDDISFWIKEQLLNKESTFQRVGLVHGLEAKAGIKDTMELMVMLKKLFDKYFFFESFQKIFKKYANKEEDIEFLRVKIEKPIMNDFKAYIQETDKFLNENKAKDANKRYNKEILKLIEGIENRKRDYKLHATAC